MVNITLSMELPVQNIVSEIDLKPSDAFLPLFESVVNSIISLKLTKGLKSDKKKIQIQIFRGDYPAGLALRETKTISSIKVIDNGEGFNNANFISFKTAYSRKNKALGCKGIGRFTILAAFKSIKIDSYFQENGRYRHREIYFDTENEVETIKDEDVADKLLKTTVELCDLYNSSIKDQTAKTVTEIAELIMQHCLIYYLCNDLPLIEVIDKETNEGAVINELYKSVSKERENDIPIQKNTFKCYITKTPKVNNRKIHYIYYCANSRVVGAGKNIAKVNSLFAYPITDEKGNPYFLDVYVVSDYLNKKVYAARNGFAIPQEREYGLFNGVNGELTFSDIEQSLAEFLTKEYDYFVKETKEKNIREIKSYIISFAPRYKRYLNRASILEAMPPNLPDDKKEEWLYKVAFNERKSIDSKIQKFIESKNINEETIQEVKRELIDKTAFDSDSLADYMIRRRAIIDLFKKFLEADEKGLYKLEKDIHNLIFPMGVTHEQVTYESHNLWLLDERFATYNFIASDKKITTYTQKHSSNEPDILMIDEPPMFDNPIGFGVETSGRISSIVVFEFKRAGETAHQKRKKDFRWEFTELIDKYFDDLLYADDKKNYKGRPVVVEKTTPKFGYIILDIIPPKLKEYNITNKGFTETPFGTLYKIIPSLNQHIEVITFDQLVNAVEKRHAPFFNKLFN